MINRKCNLLKYLLLFVFLFSGFTASASVVTCTNRAGANPIYTQVLPYNGSQDSMTAPGNPSQYKALYTWSGFVWGWASTIIDCSPNPSGISVNYLQYIVPPTGSVPVKDSASGNWIFPIPGTGFGLSFYNLDQRNGPLGDYQNPNKSYTAGINAGGQFYIKVALWKLPGAENPGNVINFSNFQVVQALQLTNSADSWGSLPTNGPNLISNTFTSNSAIISGNITLSTGTCTFNNSTVEMGTYDATWSGAERAPAPWKDASFTLQCPQAMGYDRTASINTGNNTVTSRTGVSTKNQNVNITVVPRTEVLDSARGIMALNSGGAQGYGIQLAWGTVASQSAALTPARPVIFNVPTQQATSAFGVGSTNSMTVNMAARYIRIPDDEVQAGPAVATVEVIANYN
ncbi:hypothetical protein M979_3475 [Buttiauxella noackiae ATCC 51607]|uniref:Uncharacterized protein n=2 Tax=Buttiauxella TaxID=82976 RepID=A0A1B7HIR2_9ENTR|nr:hypothetical protein M979_3475 [Buttiauxella noackiae ATCC 51607]